MSGITYKKVGHPHLTNKYPQALTKMSDCREVLEFPMICRGGPFQTSQL